MLTKNDSLKLNIVVGSSSNKLLILKIIKVTVSAIKYYLLKLNIYVAILIIPAEPMATLSLVS